MLSHRLFCSLVEDTSCPSSLAITVGHPGHENCHCQLYRLDDHPSSLISGKLRSFLVCVYTSAQVVLLHVDKGTVKSKVTRDLHTHKKIIIIAPLFVNLRVVSLSQYKQQDTFSSRCLIGSQSDTQILVSLYSS